MGDASTTAATAPRGEQTLEPEAPPDVDAGARPAAEAEAPRPLSEERRADERRRARERALERAPLTIVGASDRDRNLGIAPAAPMRIELDGGGCDIGIEIRRAP